MLIAKTRWTHRLPEAVRVADVHREIGFEAMDGDVPDRPDLSREENEFLRLMADGMSTRQIAEELKISERTAGGLMREIHKKLSGPPSVRSPRPRRAWVMDDR